MALTYRLYRCVTIGSGRLVTVVDPVKGSTQRIDPKRSKLDDYVKQDGSGSTFWDWINDGRAMRVCLARCESAVHTVIAADPGCTALSPELATVADLDAWLDTAGIPGAVVTRLEADGFPTEWITAGTTRRELLRALSRHHVTLQWAWRDRVTALLAAHSLTLDSTLNQLTAAQRNAISSWCTSRGVDVSGLTASSTIRQLWQRVRAAITHTMNLGPVRL